jgi:hypothetical protein
MLGLKVTVGADRSLEIDGAFVADGTLEAEAALSSTKSAGKQTSGPTGGRS